MSKDSWEDRRRASEEAYFQKQNEQALNRLKQRPGDAVRRSPITSEPMEQITLMGVVVDRCPTTGGIWLDAGELEEILKYAKEKGDEGGDWVTSFFGAVFGKK